MDISQRTRAALLAGEIVAGEFWPAGSDLVAAGTLRWSHEDSADLIFIGDTRGWPNDLGEYRHTVHGIVDGRDNVTLLRAPVRQTSAFKQTRAMRTTTLALGQHVHKAQRWSRAIYGTTNLSEWIAESGLQPVFPDRPGDGASGMLWEPPPRRELPSCQAPLQPSPETPRWPRLGTRRPGRSLRVSASWSTCAGERRWMISTTAMPYHSSHSRHLQPTVLTA